jgi:hypothetical protein
MESDLRLQRNFSLPLIKEKETKYSSKLLETMIHEKCSGDFCQFVPLQSYRENYMLLKNNIDNKSVPFNHKLIDNISEPRLHYTIFYNMI